MTSGNFWRSITLVTGLATAALAAAQAGIVSAPAVVVLPARLRMVEFGFRIAAMENVALVAYEQNARGALAINVWNGREWVAITANDYLGGVFLESTTKDVILIGGPGVLPAHIAGDPAWASKVYRIPSLEPAELVNRLGEIFKFSPGEWERMANENGLTLTDHNTDRRRYGKYGPPGQPAPRPAPAAEKREKIEMPPAAVIPEPRKVAIPSETANPPPAKSDKILDIKPVEPKPAPAVPSPADK